MSFAWQVRRWCAAYNIPLGFVCHKGHNIIDETLHEA